jgi:membrane protein implicated in regulation of membrane protease activity
MLPDFLFLWFSIIHQNWMDVFLWHIGAHFVPGRNITWYVIFLLALATYLLVLRRRTVPGRASSRQERLLAGDTSRPLS